MTIYQIETNSGSPVYAYATESEIEDETKWLNCVDRAGNRCKINTEFIFTYRECAVPPVDVLAALDNA